MKTSTKEGLDLYVSHGVPTGDFLYAVLCNDLMQAFARADFENREDMFEIVGYVYNELPANCHGSKEVVKAWLERFTANTQQEGLVS